MVPWCVFNYQVLQNVMWRNKTGKHRGTYNDVIMMFDTETSKKNAKNIGENHVVAWTLSIRAFHNNIVTLYGTRPSEFITCLNNVLNQYEGEETYLYAHNLCYDWTFLRRFFIREYSHPCKQINTKSHYPIYIKFPNGLILRDSLILAQRKLEKWAEDLNVEHKKAVGKWDYNKIRNQGEDFNNDELEYIECDTLAGVECIDATLESLGKNIASIPYTATGIPRGDVRELAKLHNFHEVFFKMAPTYEQYLKLVELFHGGYTHANRHLIETTIKEKIHGYVKAFDFSSSYPFVLLCRKYPMEKFTSEDDMSLEDVVEFSDERAFMFKFIAKNIRLKNPKFPMPYLQYSKCDTRVNPTVDNGRILKADYVEIYLNEIDGRIILDQYTWDDALCIEVESAYKDYLPKWFTDYIYQCYRDNKMFKGVDPVVYSITKAKTNSIYGMTVQRCVRDEIEEVFKDFIDDEGIEHKSGEYMEKELSEEKARKEYDKYLKRYTSILPYFWGVWCTSYACENLFKLGQMCETWLYSDTDSVYGINWDMEKVDAYNQECEEQLRARGYEPFTNKKGRVFVLGKAESDPKEDEYTEFRVMGAKRYCGRCRDDGELHITVAGVPKTGAKCLKDDIRNFKTNFVFDGETTGKLTHTYFFVDDIYIDENGNETGDSIDLSPCDYLLSAIDIDEVYLKEVEMQIYE